MSQPGPSRTRKGPRAIAGLFALGLAASPALAEWRCEIERSFICDAAGQCSKEASGGTVTLRDDASRYQRCRGPCVEGAVIIRRNFFGSVYKDVQGELPGLTALRSRSGEYSESTVTLAGELQAFAFGTCAWR